MTWRSNLGYTTPTVSWQMEGTELVPELWSSGRVQSHPRASLPPWEAWHLPAVSSGGLWGSAVDRNPAYHALWLGGQQQTPTNKKSFVNNWAASGMWWDEGTPTGQSVTTWPPTNAYVREIPEGQLWRAGNMDMVKLKGAGDWLRVGVREQGQLP